MKKQSILKRNLRKRRKTWGPGSILFLAAFSVMILFSSCGDYGEDGYPGQSYLALHWDITEPDYLDAGTSDIPPVFEWGAYYLTRPGTYTFYYEGEHWDGYRWVFYAWEVDYDIWINVGERGGHYYDGADGMDNFFSIVCTPYGPDVLYDGKSYKKTGDEDLKGTEIPEIGTTYTVNMKKNDVSMKVTYKRVAPRNLTIK